MATRDGRYATRARLWVTYFRGASDEMVRSPLWEWPPSAVSALKHERRRRFKWDIDSEGER